MAVVALIGLYLAASGDNTDNDGDDGSASSASTAPGATVSAEDLLTGDTARDVLPPGNYGGMPPGEHSLDQLPLYDGLTPLRDEITDADIEAGFIPADFTPIEPTTV